MKTICENGNTLKIIFRKHAPLAAGFYPVKDNIP
jgi:hypothetical protein